MGSTPIATGFLLTSLTAVILLEVVMAHVGAWLQLPRLWLLCLVRAMQLAAVLALATREPGGWQRLGLDKHACGSGLKKGLIWSAGFAAAAALLFGVIFSMGQNPFVLIRTPLPSSTTQRVLFFGVGGVLAPIVEEIVFRGLIFGYLRRWGVVTAVVASTALFAVLHLPAIPITQIIGGVVFAIAYQLSGNLATPIVIHMLGNLAIFTFSLPFLRGLG